ncbi:MAG: hypothetical protein MI742_12690 [Desulfobacterales bacterium]|nr:hypothetical protein [Desulfobacterales bacterium]
MNIERITGTLTVTDSPGLATVDPRFTDIATLVQDGKYEEAAARADEVLGEEIYDIRIIGYFAYGFFLEKGIGGLKELFSALSGLFGENLEAVGPVRNRPNHVKTIFTWFFKQLAKKLQYEEERQAALWDQWVATVTSDEAQDILDASEELRRALTMILEDSAGPVLDSLSKVGDWLRRFQGIVYREPELEAESESEAGGDDASQASEGGAASSGGIGLAAEMQGSSALGMLVRRIEAFGILVKEGKMAQAALVAMDINRVIENFDPRLYFPEIFSGFTLSYVKHINQLTTFEEHKGSVEWRAMQELYKVDLDSFVSFNAGNIQFSAAAPGGAAPASDDYGYPPDSPAAYNDAGAGDANTDMNNEGW